MEDGTLEINNELFDNDFDEVGFEPEINNGDNDEEASEKYGYNN